MTIWSVNSVFLFAIFAGIPGNESKFINFKNGFEYIYRYEGHITIKDLGKFIMEAKVSYTNIRTVNDDQELLLKVYTINVTPEQNPDVNGIENDFSKWFSFVISSRGVVNHVFYPRRENEEVVAIKKGLASIFAAKLHEEGEVPGTNDSNGFTYNVSELGGEGEHNSTYIVSLTKEGIEFKKTRHNHPVKNAKASYLKTMVYHDYLRTIHSVLIEENFTSPKTPHGFNPLHGMRKVKAVNEFSTTEYPSMSYTSRGKLTFISRHEHKKEWLKPTEHLMKAPIQIGNVKHIPKHLNFTEIRKNIATNLTCIENQPEQGSPGTAVCFLNIVNQLKKLPDKEVERLAHFYFDILQTTTDKYKKAKENMVDAFGAMSTDLSERILAEKIMLSSSPDANLVKRILTHVATNDKIPSEVMMKALEDAVFHQEKYSAAFYAKDTHSRCMLALGAVSHKLMKEGKAEKARKIINRIHANLGLHDPWEYRIKRAAMTTREKEEYDLNKVILLETLGNARLDESYDFILSHINSTNSPWIKRAGCHALRHFDHEHAANTLLYAALYDEDQSVRYEASLLYMAHPKGKMIAPMNVRETTVFDNYTMMEDPYDNGVDVIGLTSNHQRSRRSVWDGLKFRLEAPSVDWRKHIGTTDIGASFGVIMMNLLDLAIAPTQGHLKVRVHDEAYARVHVGILGVNFDFFVARVCFKGGTEYNINILQGNEMKKIIDMASNFSKKLKDIVEGIIAGVELFRRLISGNISLKTIVDDLVMAVTSIPRKVSNLVEKASQALAVIGQYDPDDLPPEFKATVNFVHRVSKLFSDIKVDVMGFVNAVEQSINVVIPHQVNAIIYTSIVIVIEQKQKIQEACFFLRDEKPYWFDVERLLVEYQPLAEEAFASLKDVGDEWTHEKIEASEDIVKQFTKGKMTLNDLRQEAVQSLETVQALLMDPFNDILGIADNFVKQYSIFFGLINKIKDAYTTLKEGYDTARGIIDAIFGPKAHKDFPRNFRLKGGGCDSGFYPASLGGDRSEYKHTGIDLLVEKGDQLVAPFAGSITVDPTDSHTVIIGSEGGSLRGITVYITNIEPNSTIDTEEGRSVASGQPIGTVTDSECDNHIHLAMFKNGGTYIDPTKYIESLIPTVPTWTQICDDYKLVFMNYTIVAGFIVGSDGKKEVNKDPTLTNTDDANPMTDIDDSSGGPVSAFTGNVPAQQNALFDAVKANIRSALDFDTGDSQCAAIMGIPSSVVKRSIGSAIKGMFSTLLKTADKFLEKFNLRRLKFGTIMEFLDKFGMQQSKDALGNVMEEIKNIIDNTKCRNPHEMTEDQLVNELTERGKGTMGSREQLVERLVQSDKSCPLLSFIMPKNVYCTFDSMCLGLECCINLKFALYMKVFKIWARLDPCTTPLMLFTIGLDSYTYNIQIPKNISFDGYEGELKSGIKLDFLGGMEPSVRYRIFKDQNVTLVTIGIGLCSFDDSDSCIVFVNLLDKAVLPVPTCMADGTLVWPEVNFKSLFRKEALYQKFKEQGKSVIQHVRSQLLEKFLTMLKISEDMMNKENAVPKPDTMTIGQIKSELELRGLSTIGTKSELKARLTQDDLTCVNFTMEKVQRSLSDIVYYKLQKDCMRIDLWTDINVKILGYDFSKTLSAYIELDPCSFILQLGFEQYIWTKVLLNYEWGKLFLKEGVFSRFFAVNGSPYILKS